MSSSSSSGGSGTGDPAKYLRLVVLGEGSYGRAYLAQSKASGRKYVIKDIKHNGLVVNAGKSADEVFKEALNEVNIIRSLCHVNIIKYKECFMIAEKNPGGMKTLSIVMEYADQGDLQESAL